MKILLTSTSFQDTPGKHHDLLNSRDIELVKMRGPLKEENLLPIIHRFDGVVCSDDEYTAKVLINGAKGKLKVVSKYGVGLDSIDLIKAKELEITVANCPGVNQRSVSEHVLALLFSFYKNICVQTQSTKKGKWERMAGEELCGKTIGIVGLGGVGKELAILANALGMRVLGYDPYVSQAEFKNQNIEVSQNLKEVIGASEILSLHVPLNSKTSGLINKEMFENMNPNLVIVNTARTLLIDPVALERALDRKKIRAYLTDVMEVEPMVNNHPLIKYDNVMITPHVGSRTKQSVERQGLMAVENLFKALGI